MHEAVSQAEPRIRPVESPLIWCAENCGEAVGNLRGTASREPHVTHVRNRVGRRCRRKPPPQESLTRN